MTPNGTWKGDLTGGVFLLVMLEEVNLQEACWACLRGRREDVRRGKEVRGELGCSRQWGKEDLAAGKWSVNRPRSPT